jgi:multiple sugar transport system substrate-binding protein
MIRRALLGTTFAPAAAALAACGLPQGASRADSGAAARTAPFTLEVLVPFGPVEQAWWDEVAAPRYREKYPQAKILWGPFDWGPLTEKLTVAKVSGGMPDVFRQGTSFVSVAAEKDLALPVDDRVARAGLRKDYFDAAWTTVEWKGKSYGLPMASSHRIYWYRQDFAAEVGLTIRDDWTWEQHVEAARRLTKVDGNQTTRLGFTPPNSSLDEFLALLASAGGRPTARGVAAFNTPAGAWALQTLLDRRLATLPPGREPPPALTGNALGTGTAAMTFTNLSIVRAVRDASPGAEANLAVPQLPLKQRRISFSYNDWNAISTETKLRDPAWDFIALWVDPPVLLEYTRRANVIPARKSVAEQAKAHHLKEPYARKAVDLLHTQSQAFPILPQFTRLASAFNAEMVAALTGQKSVKEALATAEQQWNAILSQEGWKV